MKNKEYRIHIRLSFMEKAILDRKCCELNVSKSLYIRKLIKTEKVGVRQLPDLKTEELIDQISRIGNNINQLIKRNKRFQASDNIDLRKALSDLYSLNCKILERYDS